jgi:iron complex transport system substrate-binding protein
MMHRIISLISSATEIVHALGFGGELVGRSHECDYPASVQLLPPCTEPKIELTDTSDEVDQNVKTISQQGLSVYRVRVAKLAELKPTHIIAQAQCEVCDVNSSNDEEAVKQLLSAKPQIVSLEPNSLDDIWQDIERIGTALGAQEKALKVVGNLKKRMLAVHTIADYLKPVRVALIEWVDPLTACGNWIPELVEMAKGTNLFGEAKKPAPALQWEDLVAADPDVIIVAPRGFTLMRTLEEMPVLAALPGYRDLSAVIYERVFVADGNHFFNRPGPRVADTLEMIAEILHPESFDFGHEGIGWARYTHVGEPEESLQS